MSIKAKSSAGASGGGEDKKLKKNIEYLLIYSKVRDLCDIVFPQNKVPLFDYIQEKRDNNISWSYNSVMYNDGELNYIGKTQAGNGEDIELYEVKNHTILSVSEVCRIEGITEEEVYTKYINKIFTTENAQTSIRTRVAEAVNGDGLYIARYVPTSGRNKGKITDVGFIGDTKRLVSFLKHTCVIENGKVYKLEKIGTLWNDLSWSSVSKEGGVPFPAGKKPISLIKRVISMHPNSNSTVLDFFAGSGSTAHAVMSLNIDDNGKRQCVLVTSSENNICTEKTFPRCSNVINGYGNVPGLTDNTLRYYRTDFVPNETTIRNKRRLMALATDMLCIKNNLYCEQDEFAGRKLNKQKMRFFDNGKKQMLVVYDEMVVDALVDVLAEMDVEQKIMIYVFSNTSYPHTDNFEEVLSKVELCALPSAILNAYRKITGR